MNPEDNSIVEETEVTEAQNTEPEQPDLTDVEVMSNGSMVNLGEPSQPEEGEEGQQAETTENPVQEDYNTAVASMEDAKNTLTEKGVDYAALEAEYNDKGGLSPESYEVLNKAGYPKEIVDAVIAGWQAKADNLFNAVIDNAGGAEEYGRLQKFVVGQGANAVDAFNAIMTTGNLNTINSYIAGVKAQMEAKYGTANPTLTGRGVTQQVKGFADQGEMVKAMSDRRYGRDAKYTQEVERRIALSNIFN